jgi:uncharacterized protein with GYD domain
MALYMLLGKYSPDAMTAILKTGSNREVAAKKAVEAAGGKLLGFYGMYGQEHNVAIISEFPGNAEYMGAIAPALMSGTFSAFKTIPLYRASEVVKASKIARKVAKSYRPPAK